MRLQSLQQLIPCEPRGVRGGNFQGLMLCEAGNQNIADFGKLWVGGGGFGHRRLSAGLVESL
jgi:hypothetical protein